MSSISNHASLPAVPLSSLGQSKPNQPMVVTVDGKPIQGTVHELKPGVSVEQAMEAGKRDGTDQLYVQSQGKNYVVQGDALEIKGLKKGESFTQIFIGDAPLRAEIVGVDNEANTMKEGAWNLGTKIGVGGMVGSIALGVIGTALEKGPDAGGSAMAGMAFTLISAGVAGISAAGGATLGAIRGNDAGLQGLIQE